jgi:hypothetical protein
MNYAHRDVYLSTTKRLSLYLTINFLLIHHCCLLQDTEASLTENTNTLWLQVARTEWHYKSSTGPVIHEGQL